MAPSAPTGGNPPAPLLADFIALNEEIGALVRARVPLESHLARFGAELPGKTGELAQRIGRRLEAGENLVAAIDAECGQLPATYRAAIVAGVESGQLGSALESLVDSATRAEELRRVTGVALLYPLIIIVVACVLLAVVLTQVVPSFWWLNQYQFRPLAWLAQWPLTVPLLTAVVPCLVLLAAARWWWRSGRLVGAQSMVLGRLGWIFGARGIWRWTQAASFADLLLLLVERGLPLDKSLRLAGDASGEGRLRTAAHQLADQVERGELVGDAATTEAATEEVRLGSPDLQPLPTLVRLALHHANDRKLLADSLRQAAAMYRERAIRSAEWYSEYLPIWLTLAIGGTLTVGFALFVFWPYASALHDLSSWHWR